MEIYSIFNLLYIGFRLHTIKQGDFMDNISSIINLFPPRLQTILLSFDSGTMSHLTEIRIRRNMPVVIYILKTPYFISSFGKLINHYTDACISVDDNEFDSITDLVCNNSYHTRMNTMINGYVTTAFGSRIGIASTAVYKDGVVTSVKDITSLNIRIAREIFNCARPLLNMLYVNQTPSIIVAGPPSGGKTTFLRDAARILSGGFAESYRKISVIDERGEIAAGYDLGLNTDVISNFSKAKGIEMAVRTMSPEMIICDEIGNDNELASIKFGFSSGVSFMVSVHAKSKEDLLRRTIIQNLIRLNEFDYIVLLKDYTNQYDVYDISEVAVESGRNFNDNSLFVPRRHNDYQV